MLLGSKGILLQSDILSDRDIVDKFRNVAQLVSFFVILGLICGKSPSVLVITFLRLRINQLAVVCPV